jgi:uncharacterized protein (DUF1015 family)
MNCDKCKKKRKADRLKSIRFDSHKSIFLCYSCENEFQMMVEDWLKEEEDEDGCVVEEDNLLNDIFSIY